MMRERNQRIGREDFEEIHNFVLSRSKKGRYVLEPRGSFLKARNFVGVIQTRRGTTIEILPKVDLSASVASDTARERGIFLKMLRTWHDGPCRDMGDADVQAMKNFPLFEGFVTMFLRDLLKLAGRGLARAYDGIENNLYTLKGKLVLTEHLRRNLAHQERFYVRYQRFSTNRPVNRLLQSALSLLRHLSRSPGNQALIRQAAFCLEDVPASKNIAADLIRARVDRTMPLYSRLFPWARVVPGKRAPRLPVAAQNPAVALLFPMEKIFENYVAHRLRRELTDWKVRTQESVLHLVEKNSEGAPEFRLRPDIVARKQDRTLVMDVKWKRLATRRQALWNQPERSVSAVCLREKIRGPGKARAHALPAVSVEQAIHRKRVPSGMKPTRGSRWRFCRCAWTTTKKPCWKTQPHGTNAAWGEGNSTIPSPSPGLRPPSPGGRGFNQGALCPGLCL